jgi:dTDP-glucose 4,6-dehydratase
MRSPSGAFGEEIIELVGNPNAKLTYHELPENDPKVRQPDITKAREILGWEPKVSREEGLKITLDYFRQVVDVPNTDA